MSLIWFEGFDYCTAISQFNDNDWLTDVATDGANGRFGGRAGTWSFGNVRTLGVPSDDTYIFGFAWKQTGQASNSDRYLISMGESGATHVRLATGNGSAAILQVTRGDGTVLGTCAMSALLADTWYHIQMKVKVHDSAGEVEVRVNGATVFSATGIDTRNGGTGVITAISMRGDFAAYFDDMWLDTDTFLGDCKVETLWPTGAGASTAFTPSAGSNWQNVDDATPNDDTDYNASSTVGHKDTFALGNLATAAGVVHGAQVRSRARKDDAGTRTLRSIIRTDATDFEGPDLSLGVSYVGFTDEHFVNPDTSAAWTIAEINALEAGYKVEA